MFIYFLFFGNEDFSLSSLCPSQPTTKNEICRRMVTKSNCFIWMMHLGILFIVHFVFLFLFTPSFLSWFLTGSVSLNSHLHPSSLPVPSLCLVHVWCGSAAVVFWLVSMLHPTLADWLIYFLFPFFPSTFSHVMHPYMAACNFCGIWLLILFEKCFCTPFFYSLLFVFFIFCRYVNPTSLVSYGFVTYAYLNYLSFRIP